MVFPDIHAAIRGGLFLAVAFLSSGCGSLGIHQQHLISKPNMLFADAALFNYQSALAPQIEPGSSFAGGARAGGCASCK